MKTKRLVCALLALLMVASLMPAGFAATSSPYNPNPDNPPEPDPGNSYVVPGDNSQQSSVHTHNWQLLKTIEEATCTSYGQVTQVCYDCGATQTVYTNMLPHSWGEWEITVYATDHTAGERRRTCEVCGKEDSEKYYLEGTVLPGSSGEEVEELQDLLNENGIAAPRDGEYGDSTREAVREAQRQNGLEVDGIAWLQTVNHLRHRFGDWEELREATLTKPGLRHRICEICGYDEREEFVDGLGPGARGDFVRDLQEILAELGYYEGRIDGDYGDGVKRAVEKWQRDHGMEPTGIVDRDTLNRIIEEYVEFIRQQEKDDEESEDEDEPPEDEEEPEPPEDDDEPPEDDDAPGAETAEPITKTPKTAAAELEFSGCGVYKSEAGKIIEKEYSSVEEFMPGDEINWSLFLTNTGDVNIEKANGGFLGENNYKHNDISKFSCGKITPGNWKSWQNNRYKNSSITGAYMGGIHKITSEDLEHGEFADFAYADVTFENGESVHLEAEIHFPVGGDDSVSASFWVRSLTKPENGYFYTEGEKVNYDFILDNTCSVGLNYLVYDAGGLIHDNSLSSPAFTFTYKPAKGYLEPQAAAKFSLLKFTLPHIVTSEECDNGTYTGTGAIARCTFDNGKRRTYLASPEFPCGIEDPNVSVEIVETSKPGHEGHYSLGETITFDVILRNTGNLNMFAGYVYVSVDGSAYQTYTVTHLGPGEEETVYSGSMEVTDYKVKMEKADVKVTTECDLKGANKNYTLNPEDEKTFIVKANPGAELYLDFNNVPENSKYIEGEEIMYGARIVNTGDVTLTGATLKASFNGGAPVDVPGISSVPSYVISEESVFQHTVTDADAVSGTLECVLTGECTFEDGTVLPVSASVTADIGNPALKVDIVVSSTAPDGFYKRNEQVEYQVTVSNIGNMDFESVRATIMPADNEKGYTYILQMDGFIAGASETRAHTYTVTMDDVAAGSVTAEAEAFGVLPSGKEITATANVSVDTGMLPIDLSVEKTVTSTSTYGFYEENDTITYLITVTNNGKEAIPIVEVTDVSPAGATTLDVIMEMAPGASVSYPYSYTVTGPDVSTGNVHNIGGIDAVLPDGSGYSATSEVDSATGKHVSPEEGGDREGTGPVVWYLHEKVTDGTSLNALDEGIEMSITLYEDGRAEIEINKEITAGFWTENEETITVTAEEKEDLYTKVEDTLENEQDGTLMIFRREKPEPSETK